MIITKAGHSVPFTPPWLADAVTPPVFHLRAGTLAERDLFEARLDGEFNAGPVYSFALRAAAQDGVRALSDGAESDDLTALVQADFGDEDVSASDRATLDALYEILGEHWPDYRQLKLQNARRHRLLPTLAFMTWCTGWDNVADDDGPIDFATGARGQIDEGVLRRVPALFIAAAGAQALAIQYGRGQEKNSAPPSPLSASRESSSSAAASATDG